MDIACLMGLFPKEYEKDIVRDTVDGGIQNAANKFQWALIAGFNAIDDVQIKIINSIYVGSYPNKYSTKFIPTFEFQHKNNCSKKSINVGFNNTSIIKYFSKYYGLKYELQKWMNDGQTDKVLFAYAMTSPFVELLHYVKSKRPDIVCCLVVPDLPEYMNTSAIESRLYCFLKKIQTNWFRFLLRNIDTYVLLTDSMKEWFNQEINYIVVEGIANVDRVITDIEETKFEKEKTILYAGMIEEKYGIIELVKAFSDINAPEWKLELYGTGTSIEDVKQLAKNDARVIVKGSVENAAVIKRQKEVELLVNPRNDMQEFTKYSFPSKTIEYMLSGTPMVGYKLAGMPKEYIDYFYCVQDYGGDLKECLCSAMSQTNEQRRKLGNSAREFIIQNKTQNIQCQKIYLMLKNLLNGKK